MNNPKVATIVPKAHLDLIEDDAYMMALSYACEDPEYLHFFRRAVERGAYVILDNSAVELGEPENFGFYMNKAFRMRASAIVLPDYLDDPERTWNAVTITASSARAQNYQGDLMAVPQGLNQRDWLNQAVQFMNHPEITMIGISRRQARMFGGVRFLVGMFCGLVRLGTKEEVRIHFLGANGDPSTDIFNLLEGKMFSGIDSSISSLCARDGCPLFFGDRPSGNIDILGDRYDPDLLAENVAQWRASASVREDIFDTS